MRKILLSIMLTALPSIAMAELTTIYVPAPTFRPASGVTCSDGICVQLLRTPDRCYWLGKLNAGLTGFDGVPTPYFVRGLQVCGCTFPGCQ